MWQITKTIPVKTNVTLNKLSSQQHKKTVSRTQQNLPSRPIGPFVSSLPKNVFIDETLVENSNGNNSDKKKPSPNNVKRKFDSLNDDSTKTILVVLDYSSSSSPLKKTKKTISSNITTTTTTTKTNTKSNNNKIKIQQQQQKAKLLSKKLSKMPKASLISLYPSSKTK